MSQETLWVIDILEEEERDIRSKLFLCFMNMSRFDEEVKNRLNAFVNRGKSKKVALLSLARIKMVRINARVRDALLMEGL